jgi:hypothetical protein
MHRNIIKAKQGTLKEKPMTCNTNKEIVNKFHNDILTKIIFKILSLVFFDRLVLGNEAWGLSSRMVCIYSGTILKIKQHFCKWLLNKDSF